MIAEWSPLIIALVAVSVFLFAASKMAMPALSLVAASVLAAALSPTVATGFAIPLLILADLIALARYRQHAEWGLILRLIPGLLVGFVLVALMFRFVSGSAVARLVGVLILISLALELNRIRQLRMSVPVGSSGGSDTSSGQSQRRSGRWTAAFFGILAGMTTMAANAGGAAMSVYLVKLRVPMLAFMGTSSWFFFILNVLKVPFLVGLGLLTPATLLANLWFIPAIIAGAAAGAYVFRRMDQRTFTTVALSLSFLAACWLLIHG